MSTILSIKDQISQLELAISEMKLKSRRTDFLQERLLELRAKSVKAKDGIDIFRLGKPLEKYVFITDEELLQLQTFGYCVSEETDLEALRETPQYKFQVSKGYQLGF